MQYDHGIRICRGDRFYQCVVIFRQIQRAPVEAFGFVSVRQTGEHYSHVGFFCDPDRFRHQCRVLFVTIAVSRRIAFLNVVHSVVRADYAVSVDMRTAAALMARNLCEFADKGVFFILAKGQDAVVFQQNHTIASNLYGFDVIGVAVVNSAGFLAGFVYQF